MTHEIGHSLGLKHSNNSDSMMAPFYRGWNPFLKLSDDDQDLIRGLYEDVVSTRRKWKYFPMG